MTDHISAELPGIKWVGDGYRVELPGDSCFVDEMQAARTVAEGTPCRWLVYAQQVNADDPWHVYAFSDEDEAEECLIEERAMAYISPVTDHIEADRVSAKCFLIDGRAPWIVQQDGEGGYVLPNNERGGLT